MDSAKNEVIIAIFLGIFVGLISVFAFYFITKKTNLFSPPSAKVTVPINKTPGDQKKQIVEAFELVVAPQENEIISEVPQFKITGHVNKPAEIILQGSDTSKIITANSKGDFETSLDLSSDINEIFITAISGSDQKTIEKIVYYQKQ